MEEIQHVYKILIRQDVKVAKFQLKCSDYIKLKW